MKNMMISCEKATMLVVKSEESELPLGLKISLRIHLLFCKFCKLFERQNKFISLNISKNISKNISDKTEISFTETEKRNLIQKLSS